MLLNSKRLSFNKKTVMKNFTLLFTTILLAFTAIAQAPKGINYQTIIRDSDGNILVDSTISLKLTIRSGAVDGEIVYQEAHDATTNSYGLVNLVIGEGNPLYGAFSDINWGNEDKYFENAIDLNMGGEYQVLGVSKFQSVPYALHADRINDTTHWLKNDSIIYYNKGQVGIGTSLPDSSAALDVNSNTQGFLPPRMTIEERNAIDNPAAGLIIFNTNTHCINFFNGEEWVEWGRDPMDTFECGQIYIDPRDKQAYRTVQLGEQCWFAENLNYGSKIYAGTPQTDNDQVEKYCYENIPSNCLEYGALYQWDEMMAYDTVEFTQGICPDGWHLPNQAEWQTLIDAYGGGTVAGGDLVNSGTSGFDALMNGKYEDVTGFSKLNDLSTFWSSSGVSGVDATGFNIENGGNAINTTTNPASNAFGVRCLQGLPNRADPNLKVIDTTVYNLVSDSLELAQGIYRYEIISSRKSKDIIVEDNIVVGTEESGYLRKVDESTIAGNEMILSTSEATFEDAFIEGEFEFGSDLTGGKGPAFSYTRVLYTAPGVEITPTEEGFQYEFTDFELYAGNNVEISIPQGYITLLPEFTFEFKFKNRKVKKLSFYANETLFENSLDVLVTATSQSEDSDDVTLMKIQNYQVYFVPSIPPIPIVIVITTELKAAFSYSFEAAFSATTGYTNTNYLSFGMKYEYGNWQKIWDLNKNTEIHPFTWDGNVALNQNLQIIPEINIEFYGVAGPYFNLPLWEKLEANLALPEWDYDASLDVGLDGHIGAAITIFGKTLANYNKQLFGFDKNLYSAPHGLEMISGNNQTGVVNTQLTEPLKVKVTDSEGQSWIPVKVHFSVETGEGSISEEDVWSDENGYAETVWTLGNVEGEQVVNVHVVKADGTNISGSPLTFIAIAEGENLPVADFTATPTSGTAPLTVNFTDQSTNNPTSWLWNFGDGNSSTMQNPEHTYQNEGDYTVELSVMNLFGGGYAVKENYISVTSGGNLPVADFTATPTSGTAPLTVNFTDQSTNNPISWLWNFGDGNSSTMQNPVHTYQNEGDYTVELSVMNLFGGGYAVKENYINVTTGGNTGEPCPGFETIEYGGQIYNTVLIGDQCWMAENLNIGERIDGTEEMTDNGYIEKYCYNDDPANCENYGGLYQWDEMMQYTTNIGVQGICPVGWHIPSDDEWKVLEGNVDSQYPVGDPVWNNTGWRGLDVGENLKSTSGWSSSGNGTNLYGFGALPGGALIPNGSFYSLGDYGYLWSSNSNYATAWFRHLANEFDSSSRGISLVLDKNSGLSVRCLMDN
jgi:uncharacterized protein (TIGR02145 family)